MEKNLEFSVESNQGEYTCVTVRFPVLEKEV